jgi:hypothetical protein
MSRSAPAPSRSCPRCVIKYLMSVFRRLGRAAKDFRNRASAGADPTGFFHIVSKDKGFDPLIEHLQTRHSRIRRYEDFATLSFSALPKASTVAPSPFSSKPSALPTLNTAPGNSDGLSALALARLRKSSAARPKRRKTLIRYLITHLGHDLDEAGADRLIADLSQSGSVAIDGKGAVTYRLDQS